MFHPYTKFSFLKNTKNYEYYITLLSKFLSRNIIYFHHLYNKNYKVIYYNVYSVDVVLYTRRIIAYRKIHTVIYYNIMIMEYR